MSFDQMVDNWCAALPKNGLFQEFMVDLVFLGSYPIILLCLIFVTAFLYLQKDYIRGMVFVAYTSAIVFIFEVLRELTNIPQPPKTVWLTIGERNQSVLLGYTVMSMAMYIIIAQSIHIGHQKFIVGYFICMSFIIGMARVVMGVHTATETLISWIIGLLLAGCYRLIINHTVPPAERRETDKDEIKLIKPTIINPPSAR